MAECIRCGAEIRPQLSTCGKICGQCHHHDIRELARMMMQRHFKCPKCGVYFRRTEQDIFQIKHYSFCNECIRQTKSEEELVNGWGKKIEAKLNKTRFRSLME